MEARVGIERFILYFLSKFSHQTAGSQGYSAPTGTYQSEPIYYTSTEAFTECDMRPIQQLFNTITTKKDRGSVHSPPMGTGLAKRVRDSQASFARAASPFEISTRRLCPPWNQRAGIPAGAADGDDYVEVHLNATARTTRVSAGTLLD